MDSYSLGTWNNKKEAHLLVREVSPSQVLLVKGYSVPVGQEVLVAHFWLHLATVL